MDAVLADLLFTHLAAVIVVIVALVGALALPWSSVDLQQSRRAWRAMAGVPGAVVRALLVRRSDSLLRSESRPLRNPAAHPNTFRCAVHEWSDFRTDLVPRDSGHLRTVAGVARGS
jgi:hypothetical protein